MIVDSHQHFWDPAKADYPWMTDDLAPLRRRFGPDDLEPLLRENCVTGTVLVQSRGTLDETRTLLEISAATPSVLGVVGWIDLTRSKTSTALSGLSNKLVGVRHQVHDEADPNWLLRPDVQRGLTAVADAGLVYDLLVRPRELPAAIETARRQPQIRFVLDHLGKPPLRSGDLTAWAAGVASLAELPNVTCKLSGLFTEAAPGVKPTSTVEQALSWFGAERCMFGSDWPVCLLATGYADTLDLVREAVPAEDLDAVLATTAIRTYSLEIG
jgi:L-fuconolactonase